MSSKQLQQLFSRTLGGDYNDDHPWKAVRELHRLGTRHVFEIAAEWCRSADPLMKARGADVIAQLGKTVERSSNKFPREAFSVITELVRVDTEIRPLVSGIFALGHLDNSQAIPLVCKHQTHPSAEVRNAVAFALGKYPEDTPEIRDALAVRLSDSNQDAAGIAKPLLMRWPPKPFECVRNHSELGLMSLTHCTE